jgi:hypothetical protein
MEVDVSKANRRRIESKLWGRSLMNCR